MPELKLHNKRGGLRSVRWNTKQQWRRDERRIAKDQSWFGVKNKAELEEAFDIYYNEPVNGQEEVFELSPGNYFSLKNKCVQLKKKKKSMVKNVGLCENVRCCF